MKLSTRMIIGWVAIFAGGVPLAFDDNPWFFLGAFLLSDWLRTGFEPRFPKDEERRRRWIFLPLGVLFMGLAIWLDWPASVTHPFNIGCTIALVATVAWLIRDDIRVCRRSHESRAA